MYRARMKSPLIQSTINRISVPQILQSVRPIKNQAAQRNGFNSVLKRLKSCFEVSKKLRFWKLYEMIYCDIGGISFSNLSFERNWIPFIDTPCICFGQRITDRQSNKKSCEGMNLYS